MKITILTLCTLLLASSSSFAAGKTLVQCGWNDNDDQIAIRQDSGGQLVALYSMLDHGTTAYKVELQAVPEGEMGAGITYVGKGVRLQINTDAREQAEGFTSTLSISSLKVRNESFDCKILN